MIPIFIFGSDYLKRKTLGKWFFYGRFNNDLNKVL